MLLIAVFLILAVAGSATAGAGWTLHARGPLSGWLGDHLPAWLIRRLKRLGEWFDSGESEPPRKGPSPPPAASVHARVMNGNRPTSRAPAPVLPDLPTAPAVDTAITGAALSPAQAAVVAETGSFEPEDDAELIAHVRREVAFQQAHADSFRSLLDYCTHVAQVEPASVHGLSEYADVRADSAHDAAGILRQYLAVYGEIKESVANGLILPADARTWLTAEI